MGSQDSAFYQYFMHFVLLVKHNEKHVQKRQHLSGMIADARQMLGSKFDA
jgi:hypothetical protein